MPSPEPFRSWIVASREREIHTHQGIDIAPPINRSGRLRRIGSQDVGIKAPVPSSARLASVDATNPGSAVEMTNCSHEEVYCSNGCNMSAKIKRLVRWSRYNRNLAVEGLLEEFTQVDLFV